MLLFDSGIEADSSEPSFHFNVTKLIYYSEGVLISEQVQTQLNKHVVR